MSGVRWIRVRREVVDERPLKGVGKVHHAPGLSGNYFLDLGSGNGSAYSQRDGYLIMGKFIHNFWERKRD